MAGCAARWKATSSAATGRGCRRKNWRRGHRLLWPVLLPHVNGRPEVEIGYRLARAWWGRGYATEAVLAARDYAFDTLGLSRLIALIDPANAASIRVARKAGMHYETDVMMPGYAPIPITSIPSRACASRAKSRRAAARPTSSCVFASGVNDFVLFVK